MIFVSHSSKDTVVSKFVVFLTSIGVKPQDIFCSSLEGYGIKNGKKINDEIRVKFNEANLIIYLISQNFLKSTFCTQELGAMWLANGSKKCFIIKFDDVTNDEINGFIDTSYKYSLFTSEGLSSLYDEIDDVYNLNNKQAVITGAINNLLVGCKNEISTLVEDKDKTKEELEKENYEFLTKQYYDLSIGEKIIIGSIFFSEDAVGYYQITNETIGLLKTKKFVFATANVTSGPMQLPYALQPWVKTFIKDNKEVSEELSKLLKKKGYYLNDNPYDSW